MWWQWMCSGKCFVILCWVFVSITVEVEGQIWCDSVHGIGMYGVVTIFWGWRHVNSCVFESFTICNNSHSYQEHHYVFKSRKVSSRDTWSSIFHWLAQCQSNVSEWDIGSWYRQPDVPPSMAVQYSCYESILSQVGTCRRDMILDVART